MKQRPPFPQVIDNSLLSTFKSCPQKCFREYFEHWKPRTPNIHLHAGGAYAAAMETARIAFYVDGTDQEEAIARGLKKLIEFYGDFECPPDSAKSLERMCGAFEYYFTVYPLTKDAAVPITLAGGRRGIEFSFSEPIDETHPETGDPLLYVGRFDGLMNYAGGIYGLDDKTTSSLGASWPKQWDLRGQFTGYTWGARRANIEVQGFIIRGISILKTKYDTLQPITYRPEWMVDEWYNQILRDIRRMKAMWEDGYWDFNFDHACAEFGGCVFRKICMSQPSNRLTWLKSDFEARRWDPVTRKETLLEVAE
jgi:hypothetical protein